MRSRFVGLAGGLLAAAALATPAPRPARADTTPSPAFRLTDLGVAETKGINNAGHVFGNAGGRAFSTPSLLQGTTPADTEGGGGDPKTPVDGLGGGFSIAYGVNAAGQVVGQFQVQTPDGTFLRPYVSTNGNTTQIDTLGGRYGGALGINASGQVVGSSETADGHERGFVYNPATGRASEIGTFGGNNSDARAINDAGQIAGSAQLADGSFNAFLKTGDQMQNLGTLGGKNSWAFAINPSGQVAGASETGDGQTHAFVATDGVMKDLGTLGTGSFATGINAAGHVVGWNTGPNNAYSAFFWDGRQMLNLNDYLPADSPFSSLNGATGINDAGQIVGWGTLASGGQHAFLLDATPGGPISPAPIPEPGTFALFGLLAAAGLVRRHRRAAAR